MDLLQEQVESGAGVGGRTDGDPGEGEGGERMVLQGCGDRTHGPVTEGLVNHDCGHTEPSQHCGNPEESRQVLGGRDINQAMNGGGLQELLHSLHDVHVRMKKHNLQFQVEDKKCESNLIKQTNEIKRSCQQS